MKTFYLFDEYGNCCGETSDEVYASDWADRNEGYYCSDDDDDLDCEPADIDSDFGYDAYEGCYTYDC